jgi:hypothetical protein
VLGNARTHGIARDPQNARRPRDVPPGLREHFEQVLALPRRAVDQRGRLAAVRLRRRRRIELEGRGGDHAGRTHQDRALDDAIQLPHVARPAIAFHHRLSLGAELLGRNGVFRTRARQRVLGQQLDIVCALAQRRQGERDPGQPLIEVLAEAPGLDGVREILVRRADDPDVDGFAPGRAQPANAVVLEDSQQLGLEGQRQQAHLVEEQRAPVGHVEQPGLRLPGVGERPAFVTE